ncbi:hypothetical protein AXE80_10775 [Wenyingzhuangia fucanilytica]|uniref:Uncharacterized protein n=1 Tax=Wenyingzhuangia fucanilytica TaxID=1790137 RepID=A0A1B1Y7K0_9FLAO|nr:hypothetical protein [Wenyingzhuangia fucanilytica]ANW96727.1 hypothetical protein AXE80_10775 [Wenyingzhuangia fucanilytica]
MKIDITKRQLEAIFELATAIEGMLGCSDGDIDGDVNFDKEMTKELKCINRLFIKNGYQPPSNV